MPLCDVSAGWVATARRDVSGGSGGAHLRAHTPAWPAYCLLPTSPSRTHATTPLVSDTGSARQPSTPLIGSDTQRSRDGSL